MAKRIAPVTPTEVVNLNERPETQMVLRNMYMLQNLMSSVSRGNYLNRLGKSYSDERDIYEAFGYPKVLTFEQCWAIYERGDVGSRIVVASPDASWRLSPKIEEDKDSTNNTPFEEAWSKLARQNNVFHHLHDIDKLSGIGQYGVLFMGFNDGQDLAKPVRRGAKLMYLKAYKEDLAQILVLDENVTSPRYGLPEMYNIRMGANIPGLTQSQRAIRVHHSRVLHVAEDTVDNRIYGTPRLQKPYNRLSNLELIAGSAAEMWYRGAFPGYNFNLDPEAQVKPDDLENMKNQIEEWLHDFKRHLRLRGVKVESIAPQVSDPSAAVDVQLKLISACTGIPTRILLGSERGELASSQDEKNWLDKITFRRTNYCEPFLMRPFVDRMIETGNLPEVPQYSIRWPELIDSSELDRAQARDRNTTALTKYADSLAAQGIFPPEFFLSKIMGLDGEDVKQIIEEVKKYLADEEARIRADEDADRRQSARENGNEPPERE